MTKNIHILISQIAEVEGLLGDRTLRFFLSCYDLALL